jgi:L-seryl-tRNA(Ser) seleniumtransferase
MNKFRSLPSVSVLLAEPWVEELSSSDGRTLVTATIRKVLDDHRQQIIDDADNWQAPDWKAEVSQSLSNQRAAKTTRAINGTGILLHTGLGRAVMPDVAVDSLNKHLRGNTQLEIDPHTGKRSTRDRAAGDILCELFGAEDSLVVNNNAAATLLILHSLCEGKEVVISRGELVEIGGSFRMPEIMVQSRCELKEVGSTNKAYLKDFEDAISENTGLIMQAHTSNYKIVGFTRTVPIEELIALGKEKNLPFVHDIGSGAFFDMQDFKLPTEPLPAHSLKAGSDLVFFSGDKLLGGPQAGIILGKKKYVEMCRKNPLARALRVDKMALLALEATLTLYREDRFKEVPLYSRLSKSIDDIKAEAEDLKAKIPTVFEPRVEEYAGAMGSGSMPASPIPSYRVVLNHAEFSAEDLAAQLRRRDLPIYGTIHDSLYGINLLAMLQGDADLVIEALEELAK